MTGIGGAPPFIGVISIGILELFAVGLGIHDVKVAQDGDFPFPLNLGITLIEAVDRILPLGQANSHSVSHWDEAEPDPSGEGTRSELG